MAERLRAAGHDVEVLAIYTAGDRIQHAPLAAFGGKGLFTQELEQALFRGEVDLAVHSLKDVPARLPPGLVLAAIPTREDARDALVARADGNAAAGAVWDFLVAGSRVGTSSPRRQAQLLARRPDLRVQTLRGNVETRLAKLARGECDAVVLAAAGLSRLNRAAVISAYFSPEEMCPAAGQGALAIEALAAGTAAAAAAALSDAAATRAVAAERAVLIALGAGCQTPVGAHAEAIGGELCLRAVVASADGARVLRASAAAPLTAAPEALGARVGEDLLRQGAAGLLANASVAGSPVPAPEGP